MQLHIDIYTSIYCSLERLMVGRLFFTFFDIFFFSDNLVWGYRKREKQEREADSIMLSLELSGAHTICFRASSSCC